MKNIILRLQFVGTRYAGWQRQKNAISIQQIIEEALVETTQEPIKATGCSRTDAGVHAEDFVVNFHTHSGIPPDRFAPALQSRLPRDIMVVSSREIRVDFNARRNSHEKTYRYQIARSRSPFFNGFWWQTDQDADDALLKQCCRLIAGTHDFSGFCVTRSLKSDNHCTIKQATWRRAGKRLYFKITGDRFLHHMVRFLVGTQMEVACRRKSLDDFRHIIESPGRYRATFPAPPEGLYLEKVKFR